MTPVPIELEGVKLAVTPSGNPLAEKTTGCGNPFVASSSRFTVAVCPCATNNALIGGMTNGCGESQTVVLADSAGLATLVAVIATLCKEVIAAGAV